MQKVESRTSLEKALDEHKELRTLLGELLSFLDEPRPELQSADAGHWASSLTEQLLNLHNKVSHHFREEEASGVLEDLEENYPRASRSIGALRTDHDRILADFRAVLPAAMCYAEGRSGESQNLRRWTRSIVEHIQRHEAEETELMQKLILEELGTGD